MEPVYPLPPARPLVDNPYAAQAAIQPVMNPPPPEPEEVVEEVRAEPLPSRQEPRPDLEPSVTSSIPLTPEPEPEPAPVKLAQAEPSARVAQQGAVKNPEPPPPPEGEVDAVPTPAAEAPTEMVADSRPVEPAINSGEEDVASRDRTAPETEPPASAESAEEVNPVDPDLFPLDGTDPRNLLSLSPLPAPPDRPFDIPIGEARGHFAISPNPNLDTTATEPGVPTASETGDAGSSTRTHWFHSQPG